MLDSINNEFYTVVNLIELIIIVIFTLCLCIYAVKTIRNNS